MPARTDTKEDSTHPTFVPYVEASGKAALVGQIDERGEFDWNTILDGSRYNGENFCWTQMRHVQQHCAQMNRYWDKNWIRTPNGLRS